MDSNLHERETPEPWETTLRTGLRRIDPPAGFAQRVMDRAAAQDDANRGGIAADGGVTDGSGSDRKPALQHRGILLRFTRPAWRAALATAALLALTAGAAHVEHARVEQRRADKAAAQFDEAMQVTSHALDNVSAKLERTQFGDLTKALEENSGGGR